MREARRHAMTLEEALKIEKNARDGVLDETLPGTQDVIFQAHRVHQNAYMWGSTRGDYVPPRIRWGIAAGIGMVLVTLGGFALAFLSSR